MYSDYLGKVPGDHVAMLRLGKLCTTTSVPWMPHARHSPISLSVNRTTGRAHPAARDRHGQPEQIHHPPQNMKRILVTGADGFIGSHLCEALVHAGYDVRAFVITTVSVTGLARQRPGRDPRGARRLRR